MATPPRVWILWSIKLRIWLMKNISSNKWLKPKDYGGSLGIDNLREGQQRSNGERGRGQEGGLLPCWPLPVPGGEPLVSLSLRADPSISVRLWSVLLPWFDLCSLQCITHTHLPPRLRSAAVQRARHLGSVLPVTLTAFCTNVSRVRVLNIIRIMWSNTPNN